MYGATDDSPSSHQVASNVKLLQECEFSVVLNPETTERKISKQLSTSSVCVKKNFSLEIPPLIVTYACEASPCSAAVHCDHHHTL